MDFVKDSFRRVVGFFPVSRNFVDGEGRRSILRVCKISSSSEFAGFLQNNEAGFAHFLATLRKTKIEVTRSLDALDLRGILRNYAKSKKVKSRICWFVRFLRILRITEARGIL